MPSKIVIFRVSVFSFCIAVFPYLGLCSHQPNAIENRVGGESFQSLRDRLNATIDQQGKLQILSMIAALDDPEVVSCLLDYFRQLPPSVLSSDSDEDTVKITFFCTVLPGLKGEARTSFLKGVLNGEMKELIAAEQQGYGNWYPDALWRKTLRLLEQDGLSPDMRIELQSASKNIYLPDTEKALLVAAVARAETGVDPEAIHANIRDLILALPIRPVSVVPWEIYSDKAKRIDYGKTAKRKEELAVFSRWCMSGEIVKYEKSQHLLLSYGLPSIRELVAVIEHGTMSHEKRNCLAMFAGDLLSEMGARIRDGEESLNAELPALANRLARYVDKMDDPGAFSYRYYAEVGLSCFFQYTKLPEFQFHSRRVGFDFMATITGMTERVASPTNASPSKAVAGSASQLPVGKRDAKPLNIVGVALALVGILAVSLGVWWACRRMKKKGSEV